MNNVNIDTVLLTYGGYLQKLHDFCSALVVRHQKSQAKFCWNFKFHWAPVQVQAPAPGFLSLLVITISHLSDSDPGAEELAELKS